ncbi:MAG TPA: NAD(P)-dependent oxidoreductase [Deltaproteobacteria bacterium]|nr:NAD(P)-dependent oxidoreductase [Deltaproteobacteria bacterium]
MVINSFQPATALGDVSDPVQLVQLSIGATAALLDHLQHHTISRLLYTSSAAVYGDSVECRETDRPRAAGLHAGLKVANEDLVARIGRHRGFPVTLVRLFNMYGGDDRFSIISKIVDAARHGHSLTLINEGNAIRDFVHIDDVVRAYTALMDTEASLDVVNVASGVGVSVKGLLDALAVRGRLVETHSLTRDEIRVSTANVERLSRLVDVASFQRAIDWVVAEVGR